MRHLFIVIVTLSLFLLSCGQEEKNEPSTSEIKPETQYDLDSLNILDAENFSKSSNSIIGWDTTPKFTYSLQELIENDKRPISFIGYVKDVIKKDSNYILKVVNTNMKRDKDYMAEIYVDANAFQKIKPQIDPEKDNEVCIIFNVTKISSHLPILKSSADYDGESSHLTLNFDQSLVKLEGNFVNFFLYKSLKEIN